MLGRKVEGEEVPAEPEEQDRLSTGVKQLISTLKEMNSDFDRYTTVPFVKLTDGKIPAMTLHLLKSW